ncbi:phage head closure protein [Pararhizobium gei]|uniref:phage head closure protein n=1 Tax=Pararhizobium gei TaxID=1395951 RepID=UPI0023DA0EF0|nr:phage head closure protein [Rhizobium gei]
MRSGRLDRTITVQRSTESIDAAGTPSFVWSDVATVRAEIIEASAQEFIRASGENTEAVTIFRIRFLDGIATDDRVLFDGRLHNIRQITEIRRRKGLELRTIEWRPS